MTKNAELMTKSEVADLLNVSSRTIDRYRAAGFDLGEVKLTPTSIPKFRRAVILAALTTGRFKPTRRK